MEVILFVAGFLLFIIGLFVRNKKWKKILVYGGLALFLVILVVFYDELKAGYNEGYEDARKLDEGKNL